MAGFHIENFGCRAARADGEAIAGHLRAFAERQYMQRDERSRSRGSRLYSPHASTESGSQNRGNRLLCTART
jgi:hypothetical protein